MVYNPATDFLALWRNIAGVVSKAEMPGLDYVVAALARAGLITLSVSATAPAVMQSTTAWLQTAVPSNSAEGQLFLWNQVTDTYQPATAALFLDLLQASAGQNGTSWWTSTGGPPINTVGNNGDFAVRLDEPNGIFGPKAFGVWPANPIPGTADVLTSTALDNTFGTAEGALVIRGPTVWQALEVGAANTLLASSGTLPGWETLSTLLDAVFSNVQGSVLFRSAGLWEALAESTAGFVLTTNGPNADPSWRAETPDIPSGSIMVFYQAAAPTGWTQDVTVNDFGLRIVAGAGGRVTAGVPFSTVFAQSAVGSTTLSAAQIPPHTHGYTSPTAPIPADGGGSISVVTGIFATSTDNGSGGGGSHSHSVQLALSYVDVIIASKD